MTSSGPTNERGAEAVVSRRRGISPIWLIPIIVAVVAASLAYQAIQERGIKVVIVFESAEGLTAGKSKVKYRDVEIGSVDDIGFRDVDPRTRSGGWCGPGSAEVRSRVSRRSSRAPT
jgi:paraquat-inducible protein B